jgi:hypothetical protein
MVRLTTSACCGQSLRKWVHTSLLKLFDDLFSDLGTAFD